MSKFDELKKVCEATQLGNVDFTINSTQILELLAIQAQLVEALSHPLLYEVLGDVEDGMASRAWQKAVDFMDIRDAALAAAGAQP